LSSIRLAIYKGLSHGRRGRQLRLGLDNPSRSGASAAANALLNHMVEEAVAYVQGESLKATATLLREVYQLPDHQDQGDINAIQSD
jgi:hypothetical protein